MSVYYGLSTPYKSPFVRPPLYPPTPLSPAYVHPLHVTQISTPWTQPITLSPLPFSTPILPPASTIIASSPYTTSTQFWFPDQLEPGTFPALPFGTPVAVRINPLLLYNPVNPCVPMLEWDISHRAEQAKQLTGRHVLITPNLSSLATFPATPKMVIYSDHPALAYWMAVWGPIVIEQPDILTCNVLDAIWEYMDQPLTVSDVERVIESGQKTALQRSAKQRIKGGFDLMAVAFKRGYKRVDVLGGYRKFLGLRAEVNMDGTWTAFLGLASGRVAY